MINLYVFVEDVYETRIAPNDSNLTMSDMMRVIEIQYRDFLLQLDRLPSDLVYRAEMECYAEEARIMAVAKDAAKKVVQVERLMKHLARLLEPPVYRMQKGKCITCLLFSLRFSVCTFHDVLNLLSTEMEISAT